MPDGDTKCESRMPSRRAVSFIIVAKPAGLPPMRFASTSAASFAEATIRPRIRSRTRTRCPGVRYMRASSRPTEAMSSAATVTVSSQRSAARSRASNATYAVISLVSDAGSRRASTLCAPSVLPESASTTSQDAAWIAGAGAGAARAPVGAAHAAGTKSGANRREGVRSSAHAARRLPRATVVERGSVVMGKSGMQRMENGRRRGIGKAARESGWNGEAQIAGDATTRANYIFIASDGTDAKCVLLS